MDESSLGETIKIGPIELRPLSINSLWMLEQVSDSALAGASGKRSLRDAARAIFIAVDPDAADAALEESLEAFDKKAKLAAKSIPASLMAKINAWFDKELAKCKPKESEKAKSEEAAQ
jgi:hypothetical protein